MSQVPAAALADLLRAFAELRPADGATRREIARLLGVSPSPEREPPPPAETRQETGPKLPPPQPPQGGSQPMPPRTAPAPSSPLAASGPAPATKNEISSVLVPNWTVSRRLPDWLERVRPLPESDPAREAAVPAPDPLLVPLWTRAVLIGTLSTLSEAGPVDVAALVRRVARGTPVLRIPRRPWPTLAHGVQALVDRSESMLPFAADQDWLLDRLEAVVGEDRLQVLGFEGCPSWGAGTADSWGWRDYFEAWRPLPGVTVLALTDLGIGTRGYGSRPVHPSEWQAFAGRLRQIGCPLVALVPYGKDRWPRGLARHLKILHWDPATSAREVRRVVGRALRVSGGPLP